MPANRQELKDDGEAARPLKKFAKRREKRIARVERTAKEQSAKHLQLQGREGRDAGYVIKFTNKVDVSRFS